MRIFDVNFDYKTDVPEGSGADPDRDSPQLRLDHELLWSKKLNSGTFFNPRQLSPSLDLYLVFREDPNKRGSATAATPLPPPTPPGRVRSR